MNYYKKIVVPFILLISITSCKKNFLSNQLGTLLPAEEYVVDVRTGKEYLNGIYALLSSGVYEGLHVIYVDAIADDVKPASGSPYLAAQYSWKQQADALAAASAGAITPNMNALSTFGYKTVISCNFLLNRAEIFQKENPDQANNLLGQTYVLRALAYWNLVNIFAQSYNFTTGGQHPGVIYLEISDDWKTSNGKRLTVAEIYNHIIKDLKQGIDKLPANSPSYVINRYSAMALLSRVYLVMEDYNAAKNYATAVINKVPLMIQNYPDSLFTAHDTEAILQLAALDKVSLSTTTPSSYYRPNVRFTATQDIASLLTENQQDSRRKWLSKTGTSTITWNIVKFPSGVIGGFSKPNNAYFPDVIRSSELYLIAAESYASSIVAKEDSARFFLNAIRKRANPSILPVTASGNALLDSIYKERRKELAFEGYRMFDLLRWKKGVTRSDAAGADKTLPYPNDYAIAPLPLRDVQQLGTEQNHGY